ncbi:MAG TPA: hypothetical protein VKA76_14725 [Gammaproteobacteria bacterium]|nr:hypothetical protein [Gammaproteobacteria bacterium]
MEPELHTQKRSNAPAGAGDGFRRRADAVFDSLPDGRSLYLNAATRRLLDLLCRDLAAGVRLIVVVGPEGVGKSVLLKYLDRYLTQRYDTVTAANAWDWEGVSDPGNGRHRVLLIDDADLLGPRALAGLYGRVVSCRNVQAVLAGTADLAETVREGPLGRTDRLTIHELAALSAAETFAYIDHRFRCAGLPWAPMTVQAADAVHEYTGGLPGRIDRLCRAAQHRAGERGTWLMRDDLVHEAAAVAPSAATAQGASASLSDRTPEPSAGGRDTEPVDPGPATCPPAEPVVTPPAEDTPADERTHDPGAAGDGIVTSRSGPTERASLLEAVAKGASCARAGDVQSPSASDAGRTAQDAPDVDPVPVLQAASDFAATPPAASETRGPRDSVRTSGGRGLGKSVWTWVRNLVVMAALVEIALLLAPRFLAHERGTPAQDVRSVPAAPEADAGRTPDAPAPQGTGSDAGASGSGGPVQRFGAEPPGGGSAAAVSASRPPAGKGTVSSKAADMGHPGSSAAAQARQPAVSKGLPATSQRASSPGEADGTTDNGTTSGAGTGATPIRRGTAGVASTRAPHANSHDTPGQGAPHKSANGASASPAAASGAGKHSAAGQPGIASLLAKASRQVKAYRLTLPADDNATRTYRKILSMAPGNAQATAGLQHVVVMLRGHVRRLLREGHLKKARAAVRRGLAVRPNDPGLDTLLADIKARSSHRATGKDTRVLLKEADAFVAIGQFTKPAGANAWTLYRRVLARDPGNLRARQGLATIVQRCGNQARKLLQQGNVHGALASIREGLKVSPSDQALLKLQARMQALQGRQGR